MTDGQQLAAIRADLAAIAPGKWLRAADAEGEFVEAHGDMGEILTICRIHPIASDAERRFLAAAPDMVRFLLALVDRAADTVRRLRAPAEDRETGDADSSRETKDRHGLRGKDYAAQAAMQCASPAFLRFLADRHGLEPPLTEGRAAQKVRSLCGVTSRREFNDGDAAAARWKSLMAEFENWKRAG
jgi:hypothetical protein